jgi:RND family efflux transporter MFP subunit
MLGKKGANLRPATLTVLGFFVCSGLLYGFGLPPFQKTAAVDSQPARKQTAPLAVEVGHVQRGSVEEKIAAVGSLMALRSVDIAPKIAGRIERVLVQVGDRVKDGQLIAQLDARELEEELRESEAALKVAEATLKGKQAEFVDLTRKVERAKRLFEKRFVSRQELDTSDSERNAAAAQVELARAQIVQMKARLASTKLQLSDAQLKAPFPGYVEKRLVDPGAMVSAGTPIAGLVDIHRVKVIIPVVERHYPRISVGQTATIICDAFSGEYFTGKVVRLAPVLSQETRTGEVEIEVDNPSGRLKPGMFARVEIAVEHRRDVLLVPEGALVKTPSGHGVFRVSAGGDEPTKVHLVSVVPGSSRDGQIEIRGALEVGDRVVTLGVNLLKDGQNVRVGGKSRGSRRES